MKITCPKCGESIPFNLGRKPLNLTVINVCDALQLYRSPGPAAESLGCSRSMIYKILKSEGLTVRKVLSGSNRT